MNVGVRFYRWTILGENLKIDKSTFLNLYACQCFRDVADKDYILARVAFELKFYQQFQWLGMQCIEKHIKAILLFNRIKSHNIRHDLKKGVAALKEIAFINLGESTLQTIDHFDTYGDNRYLNRPYHIFGERLPKLDHAIWDIRRYCRVLDINFISDRESLTQEELKKRETEINDQIIKLSQNLLQTPKETYIKGGYIERVLSDKKHSARAALIYNNLFFYKKYRKSASYNSDLFGENSPLSNFPEFINDISEYIYIPLNEINGFKELKVKK